MGFRGLFHPLTRDALELELLAYLVLEFGLGAEDDLPSSYHLRWLKLLVGEHGLGVALSLERYLESANVLEHHYLSLVEGFDDVLLHALEHGVAVGHGHGGGVVDALGELLEVELTGFHCRSLEVAIVGKLGVAAFGYFVVNHSGNGASPNPLPKRGLPDIAKRVGEGLF